MSVDNNLPTGISSNQLLTINSDPTTPLDALIEQYLADGDSGLDALLTAIVANKSLLQNSTYGLNALKTTANTINTTLGTVNTNTANVNSRLTSARAGYLDYLANSTYGLNALKTAINNVNTRISTGNSDKYLTAKKVANIVVCDATTGTTLKTKTTTLFNITGKGILQYLYSATMFKNNSQPYGFKVGLKVTIDGSVRYFVTIDGISKYTSSDASTTRYGNFLIYNPTYVNTYGDYRALTFFGASSSDDVIDAYAENNTQAIILPSSSEQIFYGSASATSMPKCVTVVENGIPFNTSIKVELITVVNNQSNNISLLNNNNNHIIGYTLL